MINNEAEPSNVNQQIIPMEVPNWHGGETGFPLTEFGQRPIILVNQVNDHIGVPPENDWMLAILNNQTTATFFNGPYATVRGLEIVGNTVNIEAAETGSFDYIVSSYLCRDDQAHNPIMPLAVQATIFTPDKKHIVWELRDKNLTDWPGALTVAGGAVKPSETVDLSGTMAGKLRTKYNISGLPDEQVRESGVVFETVNGIVCVTYSVVLTEDQYNKAKETYKADKVQGKARKLVLIDPTSASIEQMFLNKRSMEKWDPNGFFNVLYALAAEGLRTPQQINELLEKVRALMHEKAAAGEIQYTYPMERYLNLAGNPHY